ncbi:LuxR C-terminal-related transcriptional regulator [Parendozoicomonas haliclonae]|uniref:Spore germination protein GerE n=1 Tax=Parendozoicomonas haliclonae TaxID=1960125 RepID=A0A1X7AFW2_9GAMM|nr:LuxR C-terminal-related transcriptional regulator [Parendozoicomonas haliclonae]SMA38524.1 Spore germination protein GerE [Parendozoicomonas haliclonae]
MAVNNYCTAIHGEILQIIGNYYTIYAGVRQQGVSSGLFSHKDGMTLDVLQTSMPVALPLEVSGQYFNKRDRNLNRLLNGDVPFVYDHSCRRSEDRNTARMLQLKFALAIPVTCDTNPNYTYAVIFYCKGVTRMILEELIVSYRHRLQCLANGLFQNWQQAHGHDFNIFHSRSVFCQRALQVAQSLADGNSTRETASNLCITESGVRYHLDQLGRKLSATNRSHMLIELMRKGVIH